MKLVLTETIGHVTDFRLTPEQSHDLRGVPDLIEGLQANHRLADRAFDAEWLREALSRHNIIPVMPPQETEAACHLR